MKITRNVITISDLYRWLEDKTLVINNDYQRNAGLWPASARSYFIDTILNEFPFPKITIRQIMDLRTSKAIREVVDGQQRLTTIQDFINNKFKLSSASKIFQGKDFKNLEEDNKESFLAYEVSVDTVTVGTNEDVLEIFRRMNSFTVKLNEPEKRHATYQGRFKWFILELLNSYTPFLEKCKVLTINEIGRMEDADLMTELCQIILKGIENRSSKSLNSLYKDNDTTTKFISEESCYNIITSTLEYMKNVLTDLFSKDIIPSYLFYSIFSALVYNKYGIKNIGIDQVNYPKINKFANDEKIAIQTIREMIRESSEKNLNGVYAEFVKACVSTTHSKNNRVVRLKYLVAALQNKL